MVQSTVRIIVVDDSKEDLILTHRVLRQCKLLNFISTFASGKDFIEHLEGMQARDSHKLPEPMIIFIDLKMPLTSGIEVLSFLQASQFRTHSLAVMLSGVSDLKTLNNGYELGAKTFLVKPVSVHNVCHLLNSWDDHILIEEVEDGYQVHWKERIKNETDMLRKTSRIGVCSA